jgi:hypothetical protein
MDLKKIEMIKKDFNSAQMNIVEGESNKNNKGFKIAIYNLALVVEEVLNIFYDKYIDALSDEDRIIIEKHIINFGNRRTFHYLTLGSKMNILRLTDGFSDGLNFI